MVDLEQSIADWRQKMLAAGLATPVPLDELEGHLRDLIEKQQRAGLDTAQAFEFATRKISEHRWLDTELQKINAIKYGRHRLYNAVLVAFAFYLVFCTIRMLYPLGPTGLIGGYWVVLGSYLLSADIGIWTDANLFPAWLILGHLLFIIVIGATLAARRYQPEFGARLSWFLNWALLPFLPVGTLVGLYGLWCGGFAVGDTIEKSWWRELFTHTGTPAADQNIPIQAPRRNLSLRIICGLLAGITGAWMLLPVAFLIAAGLDFYSVQMSPGLIGFLGSFCEYCIMSCSDTLMMCAARSLLGFWLLWCAAQIFRGPRSQPKMARPLFDLGPSIAHWRQRMLLAGIEAPVPLEELEDHLRDLIEKQMRAGLDAPQAFEFAARKIGQARPLEAEFRKIDPWGSSRNRIYERALAAFAGVIVLGSLNFSLRLASLQWPGGPITRYWVWHLPFVWETPDWIVPWFSALNFTYAAAMVATLIVRRFLPKYGPGMSRFLNWALLLALPWGPLIGLYGLWCSEMEKTDRESASWLGKLFTFAMTPIADRSINIVTRMLAMPWQIMRALALAYLVCFGIEQAQNYWDDIGYLANAIARRFYSDEWSIFMDREIGFLAANLIVNAWMVWFVWQIFRGQRSRLKMALAHV